MVDGQPDKKKEEKLRDCFRISGLGSLGQVTFSLYRGFSVVVRSVSRSSSSNHHLRQAPTSTADVSTIVDASAQVYAQCTTTRLRV